MQRLDAVVDAYEEARLSDYDEDDGSHDRRFIAYPDQDACICWCAYRPEIECRSIAWGTTAYVAEMTEPLSE